MKKIKVLMVGNDSSVKGGITSVIQQLLEYDWNAVGIDMKFIPTYVEKNALKKIIFFIDAYDKIRKYISKNRPDVVHIHMSYRGSFTRAKMIHELCVKNKIPTVVHLHGSEFKKWFDSCDEKKQKQIKEFMKQTGAFIVLGEKWNDTIKKIEKNTKTVVLSNSVKIPQKHVKWDDKFKILFLGVLIKRKGVSDLLEAIKILKEKGKCEKLKFIIAGGGKEEETLKNKTEQLKINSLVEFVGWINGDKKKELLETSQMLVLPSYNEGLPIAILEAISYGMPVVSTNVGDISAAVINDKNGYLIEPGDVEKLASSLEKVFESKTKYMKMSNESRSIAESKFSDDKYFGDIKNIYLALFEGSQEV